MLLSHGCCFLIVDSNTHTCGECFLIVDRYDDDDVVRWSVRASCGGEDLECNTYMIDMSR